MSVIDTLITDRSQSDVAALQSLSAIGWDNMSDKQKEAWRANHKGAYNASDLNRVGEACAYLYKQLARYGFAPLGYVELRTDWTKADVPTPGEMKTYLSTVEAIKAVFKSAIELPETMSRLTVEGANNIERVLYETDELIHRMVYAMHQSAEFELYSGYAFVPTMNTDYGRTWAELDATEATWANWNAATWYLLLHGNMKAEA